MKKLLLAVLAVFFMGMSSYAESPEANKIVNTLQGAGEPCRTPDGQNGRMYRQSITTTTTTSSSNGSTLNSGTNSTTVSNGFNAGLTNASVSAGSSNTSTSGSKSQMTNNTTTTTTTTTSVCVPYKK